MRLIFRSFALALVGAVVVCGVAAAEQPSFRRGNELYKSGQFDEAAEIYAALVDRGIASESLFYNLGNAHFRSGRLGPAIYSYERALRLDPGLEDVHYNLAVARDVVAERFKVRLKEAEADPRWIRMSTFFSMAQLTFAFLALNVLFFGLLIGLRFVAEGFARTALVVTNAFTGVALAIALSLLVGQAYYLERVELGVVLPDQVVMREGADERRAERGLLHPGLRVEIVDRQDQWLRIRLSNGVDGWVPATTVGRL